MLQSIVKWSLERPRLVLAAAVFFTVAALLVVRNVPLDLLPDLTPAQVVIQTDGPGLVAEQVEQLITRPIEAGIVGAPGVAHVHSQSLAGLSVVTATLADGADAVHARQDVSERVAALARDLGAGAGAPRVAPMTAGGDLRQIGFTSAKLDAMSLRDVVAWTVRPRLLAVPGVARATLYGGAVRRIEVQARPADLSDGDLGFLDILRAVRRATSAAGAGFIDTPTQRVQIEPHGQALTIADVGAGQIQVPGLAPARIADVADVVEAPAPAFSDALIDGQPGVLLSIGRQVGANTLVTSRRLDAVIKVLKPALAAQGVDIRDDLDQPAAFIISGLKGLLLDLAISIVLIAVALAVLLRCSQAVLITLVSIPLALLAAVAATTLLGWTLNAMTLGGLAVALGVVIDDAVLDIDGVLKRLRAEGYGHAHGHAHKHAKAHADAHEDCAPGDHASRAQAVLAASLATRGPLLFATLALLVALSPLLLLHGAAGALLAPLAGVIMIACSASLLVSVAVLPALCWLFLEHVHAPGESWVMTRLRGLHKRVLNSFRRRPLIGLCLATLFGVGALASLALLPIVLLPTFHDGRLRVAFETPPSTSIEAMRSLGQRLDRDLEGAPGVASIIQRTGRDPTGDDSSGINHSILDIQLTPSLSPARQDEVAREIGRRLALYPGLNPVVTTGIETRRTAAGPASGLSVQVFGPNPDAIDAGARQAAAALARLPSVGDVRFADPGQAPTMRIDLNFQRLALYGLSAADVLETVQAAFQGEPVADIYTGGRVVEIAVSVQASLRRDPEAVGALLLRSTSGFSEPLSRVADVYLTEGAARIDHDDGLAREQIVATPKGPEFARAASAALARLKPPSGVYFQMQDPSAADGLGAPLVAEYILALFAVAVLLAVAFDPRTGALMLMSAALALAGGVATAALIGGVISIGVVAGLIALFGLALRQAILLTDRLDAMVLHERARWNWVTVRAAAMERLGPILTTTLLIALAVLPFAVHAGGLGHEVLGPMSIVILGGLAASLPGSLLVLPVLTHLFWRPAYGRRARRGATPPPRPTTA